MNQFQVRLQLEKPYKTVIMQLRLFSQITIKGMSFEELIYKERNMLEDFLMHTSCRDLNGKRNAWYSMIIGDLEETIAV